MNTPPVLFTRPVGAYRRLDSFTLATIIQTETWRFCRREAIRDALDNVAGFQVEPTLRLQ